MVVVVVVVLVEWVVPLVKREATVDVRFVAEEDGGFDGVAPFVRAALGSGLFPTRPSLLRLNPDFRYTIMFAENLCPPTWLMKMIPTPPGRWSWASR